VDEARASWQALQAHLKAARAAFVAGDTRAALRETDAALAIDPDCTAARALRDRITAPRRADDVPAQDRAAAPAPSAAPPLVSPEGWARFEQRTRRRRIDRRAAAARDAIARRAFADASAAIDEIRALDAEAPEIAVLAEALTLAEHAPVVHVARGPRVAATAAFFGLLLAATWLQEARTLSSYPMQITAALVTTAPPGSLVSATSADAEPVATIGREPVDEPAPATPVFTPSPFVGPTMAQAAAADVGVPPLAPLEPAVEPSAPAPPPAATAPPIAPEPSAPSDEALIRRALSRYQAAYERLDAQSARDVWPGVNEHALARAFDELDSQQITFDACDVRPSGGAATATCRGSMRYVAKVGSRDPHVEPRVWTFSLRKLGSDWKIESARIER
jgi:hypothetical protein